MIANVLRHTLKHKLSQPLHAYADLRIGATKAEKLCYKNSDSILLTFDDYGTTEEVTDILSILATHNIKAMFFLQADWASKNKPLVALISDAGHVLGNHTVTHPVLLGLPEQQISEEIRNGLSGPWFRPPQGRYNKHIRNIATSLGYSICYWTIDSRDWTGASMEMMRHTIVNELHPGAVILFHLHGAHTRELLPQIIPTIRSMDYQLTSMDETWLPTS